VSSRGIPSPFQKTFVARIISFLGAFQIALLACSAGASMATSSPPARVQLCLDAGWKFALGENSGAEQPAFNDSRWRSLDVPHDWSIEGPFAQTNSTGPAGACLPSGIGWYRKSVTFPESYKDRRVFVQFDGVMANSDVWINGHHLGHRPYGYVSFTYELTGHIHLGRGQINLLAVQVDNSRQPASRWYSGAGIYRHVRLIAIDPIHLEQSGPFVSTPEVNSNKALVRIQTGVINQWEKAAEITVESILLDPNGQPLQTVRTEPQPVAPNAAVSQTKEITIEHPQLWEVVVPSGNCSTFKMQPLYRILTRVRVGSRISDETFTTFGIREAKFEPDTGFWLNGRNFKINGVCLHHDAGGLGTAVPLRAWERRLMLLKETGCNAIRTAHNPPAPEFLDLCDRMGFLVMDELFDCWTVGKNKYDYHLDFNDWSKRDVHDTVCRDRNHPSVVVYSAGNEIHDTPKADLAKSILKGLVEVFHQNDSTRPVTQALFRPNVSHDYDDGLADLLDVIGQNYRENEILAAHEAKPERRILGTESGHDRKVWLALRDHPPYAGQFLWTGIDYLGEGRHWPAIGAGSGLFDRTGNPRPRAFQRQSWWSDRPMVYIARRVAPEQATPADPGFEPLNRRQQEFSDWTPANTAPHEETVEVYSNCQGVELKLNGKSLGSQPLPADASPRVWKVKYEPGKIEAVGRNNNEVVARYGLNTAGPPAQIMLKSDRAKLAPIWDDVAYITAMVTDGKGILVPNAADFITFNIAGPGIIAAVDSGDNSSHASFRVKVRHAYDGQCVAILKATDHSGKITLTASAPKLKSGTISLDTANRME
jgi:beta-galactosidase